MDRVDGRLDLVRTRAPSAQAGPDQVVPLGDQPRRPTACGPARAGHQHAVGEAGGSARLGEEHQREQAQDLGLVGHQARQHPGLPDRLRGEVGADLDVGRRRQVPLVEDEVQRGEDAGQPGRQLVVGRDAVRDVRGLDLLLRPREPLAHRRLVDEEGAGDLGHREPAEQPEGEGHLGVAGERRVAAGEDQPEPLVGDGAHGVGVDGVLVVEGSEHGGGLRVSRVAGGLPAEPVDGAVLGGRRQPRPRVGRQAGPRPPGHRLDERLLGDVLGQLDVPEPPHQRRDDPAVLLTEDLLDRGVGRGVREGRRVVAGRGSRHATRQTSSWKGRTSTLPLQAAEPRRARSMAASRSGASRTQNPPICSLDSA